MYRSKKEVDKHVENLSYKLSAKEFQNRAYSIARLYFEVGDYDNCQKYVEQYLSQKDNNAAAYKLLGQAFKGQGFKEKALEQFKMSLDLDPKQTTLILDICEILTDPEVTVNPSQAKYWYENAEATFPKHCITFRLHERLLSLTNSDPEAVAQLLTTELVARPKDAFLHVRLLQHYLQQNKVIEAFDHGCSTEFSGNYFSNNCAWYESLSAVIRHEIHNKNDWLYQLLLLTVKERLCVLSLTDIPSGNTRCLVQPNDLLFEYDQAIQRVAQAGPATGFGEFHASLLQHHKGQLAFHAATFLLKKAKKNQLSWREATIAAASLMLLSWHTEQLDLKANWLNIAPENQKRAVQRWYSESSFRHSQCGHFLITNIQDKTQLYLDHISQFYSGAQWRTKLFELLFSGKDQLSKTSYLVSNAFDSPTLRLPRQIEVEHYDNDAQHEYPNSLHHFVWILLNYKNYAQFKCTTFDMLTSKCNNRANCGPENLSKLDVQAYLYCAALTAKQKSYTSSLSEDKPKILPANITELLCPLPQIKWWDCVYKFTQNELGAELTDIRATISRGIEVVRCIDNHGLDPELLCHLGKIFREQAKMSTGIDGKNNLENRAHLYYESAIPLLEKLKKNFTIELPHKRMFDYSHKGLNTKDVVSLIEESKLYVALNHLIDGEYEKVIDLLVNLKSASAFYYIGETYKRMAIDNNTSTNVINSDINSKTILLYSKAKTYAYKALDSIKETEEYSNSSLCKDIEELIEHIESNLTKLNDLSSLIFNDTENKYSDHFISTRDHGLRGNSMFINTSSTPKHVSNYDTTNFRTAMGNITTDHTSIDPDSLDKLENQIKTLEKRDAMINDFMEQTKSWFDENRQTGDKIINIIQTNNQNTTDQFQLLKKSVEQVNVQVDQCRKECKDVGQLKKEMAELRKDMAKLKASSEQAIEGNDLYNLNNDSTTSFNPQIPFAPVIPPFNHRIMPPLAMPAYQQLYNQSLFNLYNQFSQFPQPPQPPGAPPIFDSNRPPVNYPGVYPTSDQMYLDMGHLVPPSMAPIPPIPVVPPVPIMTTVPTVPSIATVSMTPVTPAISTSKPMFTSDKKEPQRPITSMPVNVVITSSDPLPTCTTTPAPVLSVTIPTKHIKGTTAATSATPHNYQIQLPLNDKMPPPTFNFPTSSGNLSGSNSSTWNASSIFQPSSQPVFNNSSLSVNSQTSLNDSQTVVDGVFPNFTPNTSVNKSRTLSEKSNTSVENYDPCPDFKPIIPLPAEVKITTGEENETTLFSARAKLFRFSDKQWKERGIGEMKLLEHKVTGKVRVLMRREQVHKICANHIITHDIEIKPMKNETKAYIWGANDFADETVVLEKFCVRFKTAEIAKTFYDTFETARSKANSSLSTSPSETKSDNIESMQPVTSKSDNIFIGSQQSKTVVGGFTFSSTPTFKSVKDESKSVIKPAKDETPKSNVFSGIVFKSNAHPIFSNLFNTPPKESTNVQEKPNLVDQHNSSDTVEEFEPNIEFKPVIPLPALVEAKTGEEDEIILFENRAKLLRFDSSSKEWKERGLGNIKLLVQKDNDQKVRLLMRREQVKKVCCNHGLTNDLVFKKMPNMDKAVTWCAKDFSEGELVPETFCLRFKTVQNCDDFIKAVQSAQSKVKDQSKAVKEEQNAAKQVNQIGFGNQFKPKEGSWYCSLCYTNNLVSFEKCACCEQPKPTKSSEQKVSGQPVSSWGSQFQAKPGTWECSQCLVRNSASDDKCCACNGSKEPSKPKLETTSQSTSLPVAVGWGDKFKPKEGTWECKECLIRNESHLNSCSACNSPKNANAPITTFGSVSTPRFNFGIPTTLITVDTKTATATTSMFDGTGTHNFGILSNNSTNQTNTILQFGENNKTYTFGIPNQTQTSQIFGIIKPTEPINLKKDVEPNKTPVKPALLPTPNKNESSIGAKEGSTFSFVFKPNTGSNKAKSPIKSPKSDRDDESDDDECVSEDEGHHVHFSPTIPLPDKIEVITGEENEDELYGHRAKLFLYTLGLDEKMEWKERGIGVVKILRHKETAKLRVVMRREQVLKICLNHTLTPDIIYTPKDDKTWLFAANDFSEGKFALQRFCLRFKNSFIAKEFMDAVDKALCKKPEELSQKSDEPDDSDDVLFVSEIEASEKDKDKAKELMLPPNFYTYESKDPCPGCRGCEVDADEAKPQSSTVSSTLSSKSVVKETNGFSTPNKTLVPSFQSPAASLYGTPANVSGTNDTSIFRTPFNSETGNDSFTTPMNSTAKTLNDVTDKENTLTPSLALKSFSIFSSGGIFPNLTVEHQGSHVNTTPVKCSILAPPKLNTSSNDKTPTDVKSMASENSIFGNLNIGGASSNKSIFSYALDQSNKDNNQIKSVFGGTNLDQKPVNFFTDSGTGSIFGPSSTSVFAFTSAHTPATTAVQTIFSSANTTSVNTSTNSNATSTSTTNNQFNFESGKNTGQSLFGNSNTVSNKPSAAPIWSSSKQDAPKPDQQVPTDGKDVPKPEQGSLLNAENSLSFEALSTSGSAFPLQKNPNFKWQGEGEKLFGGLPKKGDNEAQNTSGTEEGGGTAEEEYDPHYEPIVALPDIVAVSTGEEEEEKIFGERAKLFRFDAKGREWKERGVGELKILYHPEKKIYRLLLRREQVHKAVLNMLIFMDMELLPMKTAVCGWTWAGHNFAENPNGEQETLAIKFKTVEKAKAFKDKVEECVRTLQAAAAQKIREEKEAKLKPVETMAPLRLPKHLQDSSRADSELSGKVAEATQASVNISQHSASTATDNSQYIEEEEEEHDDEADEDDNEDYAQGDEQYYTNEEYGSALCSYVGQATVSDSRSQVSCPAAQVQLLGEEVDDVYYLMTRVTDPTTGELLADVCLDANTEVKMSGQTCSWTGFDYTIGPEPLERTVSVDFADESSALEFYDYCEMQKLSSYSGGEYGN